MFDIPIEKRFSVLCEISRAQHFAWREAVCTSCPDAEVGDVVLKMWEVTGRQTAQAYAKRIDPAAPLAPQVAAGIVWSSACMGEDAVVEPGDGGDSAFVRHTACPWLGWHERLGLLAEDRPGCDRWFQSTLDTLGKSVGATFNFETLESLPEGGSCCLRRLWVER